MSWQNGERPEVEAGFARTLMFGAAAAAGLPIAVLGLAPVLGADAALGLTLVLATAGYLVVLTPGPRGKLALGFGTGVVGLIAWSATGSVRELLLVLTLGVSLVRSGVLYRRRPLRAVVIEAIVGVGSLATVRFLAAPGLLGSAIALWGWFVVQSFYFLLGGLARRRPQPEGDAFETARQRLEELLTP
jgi:hypothetical protein